MVDQSCRVWFQKGARGRRGPPSSSASYTFVLAFRLNLSMITCFLCHSISVNGEARKFATNTSQTTCRSRNVQWTRLTSFPMAAAPISSATIACRKPSRKNIGNPASGLLRCFIDCVFCQAGSNSSVIKVFFSSLFLIYGL